jgi:hypothetical protein
LAARASDPIGGAGSLINFPEYLVQKGRTEEAATAWNELVSRGILASGLLSPGSGKSVADPDFQYPLKESGFGWRVSYAEGIFASAFPGELKLELDGNEPEPVSLLSTVAPVTPARSYRLFVKLDPAGLKNRQDPGFTIRVIRLSGESLAECPVLPLNGDSTACPVAIPADVRAVRIELRYQRAPGTVRAQGALRILQVALGFAA